ncbi:short-chain dehydrogenase [Gluconobacter oxydans]|uniref:SDR family NAD(P)-dependent oxidoreductase n=1 Tax=Gluconobacter TaxID=441 RepID=UPI000299936D|nr:SDR family NAD(P)-dependent oxidoreductase [Gluconobacter thailandicus]AFW00162.1 putative short-chain dehydrogenase/reductase (SDR) [Gluconobacter oxydans H24]ANQ41053.1 short-chain dehydrogenase [Gluconobacter oxydans]
MTINDENDAPINLARRTALALGGGVATIGLAAATRNVAAAAERPVAEPVNGPYPVPPPEKTAGPIKPGRGTMLNGKVAVVTGAARGIGRAIAVEYAANGADVIALDIAGPVSPTADAIPATKSELEETVSQIRAYGRRGEAIVADIRKVSQLRKAADHIEKTYGKIDCVVANAAIQGWKPILEMNDEDWEDQIQNNLTGTANTVRAFAPKMVERKYGRLILLSSMQGRMGTMSGASYSASKWGILGLMKSAALELGRYNITCNAILPGLVGTALTYNEQRFRAAMAQSNKAVPPFPTSQEAWDARAPTVPVGVGWLQPEDISPMAVFLASDAAALVTGAEMAVTGGDAAKVS